MVGGTSLPRECGEVLAQDAQRVCGCPAPGGVQGQAGWGCGQSGLVLNVKAGSPACGSGFGDHNF